MQKKKLSRPVTLFLAVEKEQHEALRKMAFDAHRSLADVVRQALEEFLTREASAEPTPVQNAAPKRRVVASPFKKTQQTTESDAV